MNKEIDIILSHYFSGEVTEEELFELEVWLSKSYENEKQFYQLTLLYQYAGQTGNFPAVDTSKALSKFKTYLAENQNKNMHHAELVSTSPAYNAFNKKIAVSSERNNGEKKHNDRHRINSIFRNINLFRAAAVIAILMISSFAVFYFIQPAKTIQLMAVETLENYKMSESTNVTLFAGAEISYQKGNNTVQLKGKATFNIHSKTAEGIVVQAGETYIKNIGTIFTVDASAPDKSITVEVTEGEVWFYTKTNTGIQLKFNEIAIYDAQTKQFKMIEKQADYRENEPIFSELVFQNIPLQEAIDVIKIRYGIDIVIASKELNKALLNVNFDKNESIEYVLEIITETIPAHLSKKGNTYIISHLY